MLKRWLPQDRILKQAVNALIAFVLCLAVAGGLGAWDGYQRGWTEEGHNSVAGAVWQYGANSPEAAAAVQQLGQSPHAPVAVALLDPATGKAISAWPADLAGKTPDQMALAGGAKLPAIDRLTYRSHFKLRGADNTARVSVQVTPLYPWSGDNGEGHGDGRGGEGRGGERGHDFGRGGEWGGQGRQGGDRQTLGAPATAVKPDAILLVASPPETFSLLRLLSGFFGGIAAVLLVVFWLSIAWWVFTDARRRGSSRAFAWGLLTLLSTLVGLAVYLVARREQRHCGSCGATVERGFNNCPHCGDPLKRLCPQCGHQLRDGWTHCANCGSPYSATPTE